MVTQHLFLHSVVHLLPFFIPWWNDDVLMNAILTTFMARCAVLLEMIAVARV
jgi:hypothetical protein